MHYLSVAVCVYNTLRLNSVLSAVAVLVSPFTIQCFILCAFTVLVYVASLVYVSVTLCSNYCHLLTFN